MRRPCQSLSSGDCSLLSSIGQLSVSQFPSSKGVSSPGNAGLVFRNGDPHQVSFGGCGDAKGLKIWTLLTQNDFCSLLYSLIGAIISSVVSKQKGSDRFSQMLSSRENLGCSVFFCNISWPYKCHGRNIGCLD